MATGDSYSALWVSHSSITDFIHCPRSYFLKNVYKDPKTGHKIKIVTPPLTFGQVIHEVIDTISHMPVEERFKKPLVEYFDILWKKYSGKRGGFENVEQEHRFKERGLTILNRLTQHPGPLARKAVKIQSDMPILHYWLSEENNIILCGKIDWLEYLPEKDAINIIDFKTSKIDEQEDSLQLPIYVLLAKNTQKRYVEGAYYWYIERADQPVAMHLPNSEKAQEMILDNAKKIQVARKLNVLKCPFGTKGCKYCLPYEKILQKEAQFVGVDDIGSDMYFLGSSTKQDQSIVL